MSLIRRRPVFRGSNQVKHKPGKKPVCIKITEYKITKDGLYTSLVVRKPVFGFPTRSDTNRTVQQQMARDLKFRIKEKGESYHLCSEIKGADQLCGYRTSDLLLCFRICKKPVFS